MKHAISPFGVDYALCGVTLDGDLTVTDSDGQLPRLAEGLELVSCPQCRAVIKHCRDGIHEYRGNFRNQRRNV